MAQQDQDVRLRSKRESLVKSIYDRAEIRADPDWEDIELAGDAQTLANDTSLPKEEREAYSDFLKEISSENIVKARRYYGLTRRIEELTEQIHRHKERFA